MAILLTEVSGHSFPNAVSFLNKSF